MRAVNILATMSTLMSRKSVYYVFNTRTHGQCIMLPHLIDTDVYVSILWHMHLSHAQILSHPYLEHNNCTCRYLCILYNYTRISTKYNWPSNTAVVHMNRSYTIEATKHYKSVFFFLFVVVFFLL